MKSKMRLIFCLLLFVQGCNIPVPSFEPDKKIIKQQEYKNITIELIKQFGIIDQKFPYILYTKYGDCVDTLLINDDIKDFNIKNDTIEVIFLEDVNLSSKALKTFKSKVITCNRTKLNLIYSKK